MKLYTCQMSKWRSATNFLDITVKSGDKRFAPTWDLLWSYKNGGSEEEYTAEFMTLMRKSFKEDEAHWRSVLDVEILTIGCYCRSGVFCHRLLLVGIISKVCTYFKIPFQYEGEV